MVIIVLLAFFYAILHLSGRSDAITVTWVKNFTNNVLSDHLFGGGQPVLLVLATFLVYTKKRKENNYKTFLHVELSKKKGRIG